MKLRLLLTSKDYCLRDSFYSIAVKTLKSALLFPTKFLYADETIALSSYVN